MKKVIHVLTGCVIVLCILAAGCGKDPAEGPDSTSGPKKKAALVRTVPVQKQPIAAALELTGDVIASNAVTLRATVDGPAGFFPWREGDSVEKGEVLLKIDRPLYVMEVQNAEAALAVALARQADLKAGARPEEIAQLEQTVVRLKESAAFAEKDFKRIEKLVKDNSLPGEMLDKARLSSVAGSSELVSAQEKLNMMKAGPTKTDLAVAEALVRESRAKLGSARARLDECIIHAPFTGVVTRVYINAGDLAAARTPLMEMMDSASIVVRFSVPEKAAMSVHKGNKLTVRLDAVPGKTFSASVARVYPELDPVTRTRRVEAGFEDNAGMVPGLFARVFLTVAEELEAVVVPVSAVLTGPQGKPVVFTVTDGKAMMRNVSIGIEAGRQVQILEGVQPGDMVVTDGNEKLKNGASVKVMNAQKGSSETSNKGTNQ